MSRYLERAEHTARLVDVQLNQMLDQAGGDANLRWERLLRSLRIVQKPEEVDAYSVTQAVTFDTGNSASIVSCITAARENARQVREQIWYAEPHRFLNGVKENVYLFQGITDATMSHSEGWHFIRVGRFLERAIATTSLLDTHFSAYMIESPEDESEPVDYLSWVGLLKPCASFEAYCKVYTAVIRPANIAEFLPLSAEMPRCKPSPGLPTRAIQDGLSG